MTNAYSMLPAQKTLKAMILQEKPELAGPEFIAEFQARGASQNIPLPSPVNESNLSSIEDANDIANELTAKLKVPVEVAENAFGGIDIDYNFDNSGEISRRGYSLKFSFDCKDGSGLVEYSPILALLVQQHVPGTYLRFSPSNAEVCYWPHTRAEETFTIAYWDAAGNVHPLA